MPHNYPQKSRTTSEMTENGKRTEENAVYPQEDVVDLVVAHAEISERIVLYRIIRYGYTQFEDNWAPVEHVPRSKTVQYPKRTGATPPFTLDRAQFG